MTVEQVPTPYAPMTVWNFSLKSGLSAASASKDFTFASMSSVGKMSGFFATPGSIFRSSSFAPSTGQM